MREARKQKIWGIALLAINVKEEKKKHKSSVLVSDFSHGGNRKCRLSFSSRQARESSSSP